MRAITNHQQLPGDPGIEAARVGVPKSQRHQAEKMRGPPTTGFDTQAEVSPKPKLSLPVREALNETSSVCQWDSYLALLP